MVWYERWVCPWSGISIPSKTNARISSNSYRRTCSIWLSRNSPVLFTTSAIIPSTPTSRTARLAQSNNRQRLSDCLPYSFPCGPPRYNFACPLQFMKTQESGMSAPGNPHCGRTRREPYPSAYIKSNRPKLDKERRDIAGLDSAGSCRSLSRTGAPIHGGGLANYSGAW